MTKTHKTNRERRRKGTSAADVRKQSQSRKGAVMVGTVIAGVLALAGAYAYVNSSIRSLDEVTLCPSTPDSITVLLVDVTDPMNLAQRQDFINQLIRLKNTIPRFGKLIVAKVDATSDDLLKPLISRCNPGTASDVNSATGDKATVQKQWDEGFDKPLTDAFDLIASASPADQSPILESIQSVALTELQRPGQDNIPKRLIVASDLLQNTGAISFYGGTPDGRAFVDSPAFRRVRTNLRDVEVELWMLERSDSATTQPRALADLWTQIINAEGGDIQRIYNVSG